MVPVLYQMRQETTGHNETRETKGLVEMRGKRWDREVMILKHKSVRPSRVGVFHIAFGRRGRLQSVPISVQGSIRRCNIMERRTAA